MNQLMANVSTVPSVRQLTALRIDLVCVSAPSNDDGIKRGASSLGVGVQHSIDTTLTHKVCSLRVRFGSDAAKLAIGAMDLKNSLIALAIPIGGPRGMIATPNQRLK
jgi:hypothetical protein